MIASITFIEGIKKKCNVTGKRCSNLLELRNKIHKDTFIIYTDDKEKKILIFRFNDSCAETCIQSHLHSFHTKSKVSDGLGQHMFHIPCSQRTIQRFTENTLGDFE